MSQKQQVIQWLEPAAPGEIAYQQRIGGFENKRKPLCISVINLRVLCVTNFRIDTYSHREIRSGCSEKRHSRSDASW